MFEITIKDKGLVELNLTSSVKRHEKLGERLVSFQALYTFDEFMELYDGMKEMKDTIDIKIKGKSIREYRRKGKGGK